MAPRRVGLQRQSLIFAYDAEGGRVGWAWLGRVAAGDRVALATTVSWRSREPSPRGAY